ncbi:reverse transcriptase domain-containing protein [Tanacetum coccineum]
MNVNTSVEPEQQKRRVLAPEKSKAVTRDVEGWVKAGIFLPVRYPTWIANPVLVKKCDGDWRMYAYKGYNQIHMSKEDEEKTMFYTGKEHVAETFDNLRKINMKLNPKKCSFGVEEGKFLGYMVTSEGIRANLKKTRILADLQSPHTLKEMQSLAGKLAALNRCMAKSEERSLPFFNTLKNITKENKHEYKWTIEAEEAFQQVKRCIMNLPSLTPPYPKETLYAYLAVSTEAVSYILLTNRKGKQNPVQYVRKKLCLDGKAGIVIEASGKLAKYAVELGAYNITFEPRNAVKGQDDTEEWILFTDGASSSKGFGAGLVLISPSSTEHTYALRLTFDSTNNEAEYEALLAGLRIAKQMNYLAKVKEYITYFESFSIKNIPRSQNQKADVLSKLASVAFNHLTKEVLVKKGIWPEDKNEARNLRVKINQYAMEKGVLFNKSYLILMLRCVGPLQENYVIREINMGSCGMHSGPRAVVRKAMRQGYYWPTMHEDAKKEIQKCDSCQIHSAVPKLPKTFMTSIMAPWPFGLPRIIVTDNGTQFVNDLFKSWCTRLNIQHMNTAVAHPQANGLVERANKSLMEGIKTRLGKENVGWVDELPSVLWAHRTSIKTSNGETPFSLTYGSEAITLAEIGISTYRTMMIKEGSMRRRSVLT